MSRNFELMQEANAKPAGFFGDLFTSGLVIEKTAQQSESSSLALDVFAREEFAKLVQNVFLLRGDESAKSVVFAGIDSRSGCSEVCARAARILASHKVGSVCLVDANMYSPSLPGLLGVSNHFGLSDSLRQDGRIQDFVTSAGVDNLWLLSCGSFTESTLGINSGAFKSRLCELRVAFDFVLIDSPPTDKYADGATLGRLSDGLVLIIRANSTRREAALSVTRSLRAANVPILGAVLNGRTFPIPGRLYRKL